jgi:tRNA G18 (ribose-2'-O)-methylase SpoU
MPLEEIQGADDPRVSDYRALSDRELLRGQGLFIAEGRIILQRIVTAGRFRLRSVLVSHQASRDLATTLARVDRQVPVYVCPAAAFLTITGFNIHRGCLALVERPPETPFDALVAACDVLVVLENVANADNVGGVFRNAAAFGAGGVVLNATCCDPLYRKAIRTSMGAALAVPFVRLDEWPSPLEQLRGADFTVAALTPDRGAQTLDQFARASRGQKVALMIGNEGSGLSAGAKAVADAYVRIPMRPGVDSLNLAVASGIALHHLFLDRSPSALGVRCSE